MNILKVSIAALGICLFSPSSFALTCGGLPDYDRVADVSSASSCQLGAGNLQADDIGTYFGSSPTWDQVGELTDAGTNGFLSVTVDDDDNFGGTDLSGDWQIDSSFWLNYSEAVISMHVGNGGGDPDHFAWLMLDNSTSGTWSYQVVQGKGGGLSNIKLWGRGTSVSVSEPATLALLGLGLVGLGFARRKAS